MMEKLGVKNVSRNQAFRGSQPSLKENEPPIPGEELDMLKFRTGRQTRVCLISHHTYKISASMPIQSPM